MLTIEQLKAMPPDTIFATGVVEDSPDGVNISRSGRMLRWVAVRGGIPDWAIYIHLTSECESWIRNYGDKIFCEHNIRKLVPCDNEAFGRYRK